MNSFLAPLLLETETVTKIQNPGKSRETKERLCGRFCTYKQRILLMGLYESEVLFGVVFRDFRSYKVTFSQVDTRYRKIPKISPGDYIFQWPFLRGLFLEGLIFGRAYVRREICVSKSIGLACSGKESYHFCFVLLCI